MQSLSRVIFCVDVESKSLLSCRYGGCFPYNSSGVEGIPCDDLYQQNVTYIYLSSDRAHGNFENYLRHFHNTDLVFNIIPMQCIDKAKKILCHYYLPTCGNTTVFNSPTSVCRGACEHLRSLCPKEFELLTQYFQNSQFLAEVNITMINCSNTGDFIDPLQHCCTDLDIEIRKLLQIKL